MATIPRCSVFNGNVLPNQPSELDATKYPNWLILYGTNSTTGAKQYIWLACSKPFLKYAEGVYVFPADAEIIGFVANKSTCTWSLGTITKEEGPADYYTFSGTYVWSYQPIYSHSDSAVMAHPAGDMVTDWDAEEPTITALTGAGTAESPTGYWQGDTPTALTCTATVGDGGTLSYKWYRNGSYVGSGSNYTPSTATAGQFVYRCEVTNTLTGASGFSDVDSITSEAMVLVVTASENEDGDTEEDGERETAAKRTKAYVMGYVLRQCGVPMAELIAEMICKVKKTVISTYNFNDFSGEYDSYAFRSASGNDGLDKDETIAFDVGEFPLTMQKTFEYNRKFMPIGSLGADLLHLEGSDYIAQAGDKISVTWMFPEVKWGISQTTAPAWAIHFKGESGAYYSIAKYSESTKETTFNFANGIIKSVIANPVISLIEEGGKAIGFTASGDVIYNIKSIVINHSSNLDYMTGSGTTVVTYNSVDDFKLTVER